MKISSEIQKSDPSFKSSFFGLFDGHGGNHCSDFLWDNLHKFIVSNIYFPHNVKKAILQGFKDCEVEFLHQA